MCNPYRRSLEIVEFNIRDIAQNGVHSSSILRLHRCHLIEVVSINSVLPSDSVVSDSTFIGEGAYGRNCYFYVNPAVLDQDLYCITSRNASQQHSCSLIPTKAIPNSLIHHLQSETCVGA